MNVTAINRFSNASQYRTVGFIQKNLAQVSFLSAIKPISAISGNFKPSFEKVKQNFDKNDVNFEKVKEYEQKIFGENNSNSEPKISALPEPESTQKNPEKDTTVGNSNSSEPKKANGEELNEEEKDLVKKLEQVDKEVRIHEQAHLSASGGLAMGGASFSYTKGPDGKQYAVAGEVNIDMGTEDEPSKTIAKMERVIAAAMAPADPSSQDYAVAASAKQVIATSKKQEAQLKMEESQSKLDPKSNQSETEIPQQINPVIKNANSKLKTYENQKNSDTVQQQLGRIANYVA